MASRGSRASAAEAIRRGVFLVGEDRWSSSLFSGQRAVRVDRRHIEFSASVELVQQRVDQ